jgi:signal transduction histidine kinase
LIGRRLWVETGVVVAFWVCVFLLTIGERATGPGAPSSLWSLGLIHTAFENVLWLAVTPAFFWLTRRFGLERGTWPGSVLLYLGTAFGLAVAIDYTSHALFPVFQQPYTLARSLWELGFIEEFSIALVVLMAGVGRAYFLQFQERRREALRYKAEAGTLQAQLSDARLEALRMQINPHFLFNTLHSISTLAGRDPKGVQRMIARLSSLLRRVLEGEARQEVPLEEELSFIRDYLEIQRIRFEGRLAVSEDIEDGLKDALVPDLILQPLVENAIKHGADGGSLRLGLRARRDREAGQLVLAVSDDGPGIDENDVAEAAEDGRVGLANIRKRLESLYGPDAALDLSNAPEGGLVATLRLPYHTATELRTEER